MFDLLTAFDQKPAVPAPGPQQSPGVHSSGADLRSPGFPLHCHSTVGSCPIAGQGVGSLEQPEQTATTMLVPRLEYNWDKVNHSKISV